MAPKAMKRPSEAAPSPAKKGRKSVSRDPVLAKCDSVASALLEAESLPGNVREMLANSLPSCLSVYKADRHNFQHGFVAMVGEALSEINADISRSIAEAEAEIASADTRKAGLEATAQACAKTLEDKKAVVSSKKEALDASTAAKKAAAAALKEAEKEETVGNQELDSAAGRKEELDTFRSTTYKEMTEKAATKTATNALAKLEKKFTFEGELIKAVSSAFAKAPAARGTFEGFVVQRFEEQMDNNLAGLTATLAQGEPGKQERAAKVASAKSSLEVSQAADDACSQALADARTAEAEAQQAVTASNKELAAFLPSLEKTASRCDALKAGLTEFSENAMANFKELEAREVPPPEVEEPAVVAEAPVESVPAPVMEGVPAAA